VSAVMLRRPFTISLILVTGTRRSPRLLGIDSRYEMDGFLKAHGVFLDLSLEDVRRDSEAALAPSRQ
jgi:hypothetical protein